jgi:hypothetical protein
VPSVIAEVYERQCCDTLRWETALKRWDADRTWADGALLIEARNAALRPPGNSVDGLNQRAQDAKRIMVRAGELPLEISLLQKDTDGLLHAVGSDITFQPDGTVVGSIRAADVGARVIASTVRISNKTLITALCDNPPLSQWEHHPWLGQHRCARVGHPGKATVPTERGDIRLTFSREVGLSWKT